MSQITYIGLGSNLGESQQIMLEAYQKLATLGQVRASKLYHSPPMGPQDQPHYHNAVVELITELEPLDLLDHLQRFEQEAGRVRLRHWGERTLDLDLLIYSDQHIQNDRLTVPHIGVLERDFVLLPLVDLNADLVVNGHRIIDSDIVKKSELTVLADQSWVTI